MDYRVEERLLGSEEEGRSDLKWRIWDESKKIWRVAAPGILARVSSFGLLVVTQSFIGHISELDLAAYALVQSLTVRFVNGILVRSYSCFLSCYLVSGMVQIVILDLNGNRFRVLFV